MRKESKMGLQAPKTQTPQFCKISPSSRLRCYMQKTTSCDFVTKLFQNQEKYLCSGIVD